MIVVTFLNALIVIFLSRIIVIKHEPSLDFVISVKRATLLWFPVKIVGHMRWIFLELDCKNCKSIFFDCFQQLKHCVLALMRSAHFLR